MDKLISIKDAAELLALKPATLRKWLAEGRLQRVKLGSATRLRQGDIEALIRLGTQSLSKGRPRDEQP